MAGLTSDSKKPQEFEVFDSIIHGELRPFLSKYSSTATIEKLIRERNTISFVKIDDELVPKTEKDIERLNRLVPIGEKFILEFDDQNPDPVGILSKESDEILEPLIDIDIPPPPDKKAEYFLSIIEDEYDNLKKRAQNLFDNSNSTENARFIAEKRIQKLKLLAVQAHRLFKQLPSKDMVEDSDSFIIYVIKTFLIRSIIVYEQLFQPFLKTPVLDEYELRTELFGHHSREDMLKQMEQYSHDFFYRLLSHEIKALDAEYKNCSSQFIENITSNESWYDSVAINAIQNNFIGYHHLVLVLANDSVYLNDSNHIKLCKTYDIECMKDPPFSFEKILSNLTKADIYIRMWKKILSNWTAGNFPNLDNKHSGTNYIPFFYL